MIQYTDATAPAETRDQLTARIRGLMKRLETDFGPGIPLKDIGDLELHLTGTEMAVLSAILMMVPPGAVPGGRGIANKFQRALLKNAVSARAGTPGGEAYAALAAEINEGLDRLSEIEANEDRLGAALKGIRYAA